MLDNVAVCSEKALPRLAYKVEEAPIAAGVSRTRIFGAIKNKQLPARKAGKSTIILADDLSAWLKSLPYR